MSCRKNSYACIPILFLTCVLLCYGVAGFAQNDTPSLRLGNTYVTSAKTWRDKKDTTQAMLYLRKAKQAFVANGSFREAAETVLNMEEFYQYFGGREMTVRIAYYEEALPLFQRSQAKDREEATLKVLGDFYQVTGNFQKALQYLQQALTLIHYASTMDKEGLYDLLGTVYAMTGNLNKALTYGLLAIKMVELGKDSTMQACAVYNRVGITYYNMKQFERAKLFYEKALDIAVRYGDIQTQINQYVNIAQTMTSQDRYMDCIVLLKKITSKYPASEISRQIGVDFTFLRCYTYLKMFDEAKVYAERMEAKSKTQDVSENYQPSIQSILTAYYIATGQNAPAITHLAILKKLGIKQQNPIAMALVHTYQARLDSLKSNFASAYKNHRIAGAIRDSIWNENQSRQVSQLQIQFEAEKKDQLLKVKEDRIKLLSTQARLQQVNLEQEKTSQRLILCGAILAVILLGITLNGYRLKRVVNRQLQAQRKQIQNKNESLRKLVLQKDNLLGEKEWLMKEIHHRVKNNLQIVISLLSTQSKYLENDIAYNAIRESQHRMQSISLIHQKLYQSDNLALVDINAYILDLVAYLRDSFNTGSRIAFELEIADAELDVTRAVPLGLILNEAITNSIKYAFPDGNSGTITISLKPRGESSYRLIIKDNGIGLPAMVDIATSKSLGMSLMRGLSKQLGGSFSVETGTGITIVVDFIDEKLLKAV